MANETITGKIFTLKDPTGNYNRFPRTVMEAVYGLNTYLQNQFSALADIYMPIEGITESKPLQEFVYRLCPSSIKAKSVSLDRIYGKTLAWNQLVRNGNFEDTSVWAVGGGTFSVANNVGSVSITNTPVYNYDAYLTQPYNLISGHKYLIDVDVYCPHTGTFRLDSNNVFYGDINSPVTANTWVNISVIRTAQTTVARNITMYPLLKTDGYAAGDIFKVRDVNVIDLTLLYGSEIDGMTDAQILAKFEAEFPGYHDYSAGKLISNDAAAVETVGFNQWDEEWESGNINQDGQPVTRSGVIRSKNFIPVLPSTAYYFYKITPAVSCVQEYDANKNHIKYTTQSSAINYSFTPSGQTAYIKITVAVSSYAHDICINLSDPAKNGTYEPYRKSTMPLNLNAIKVYSHNIWDEEWEVGGLNNSGGGNLALTDRIRSKGYIDVIPNTDYYFRIPGTTSFKLCMYNANKEFMDVWNGTLSNVVQHIPENCKYIRFSTSSSYGTIYNHDICINVSSSFNGQYEPHGILTIEGGLKGAGSVCDEIASNKLVKRVGRVDLGTITWTYQSSRSLFSSAGISSKVKSLAKLVCSKYTWADYSSSQIFSSNAPDKSISACGYNTVYDICIKDSKYTDGSVLKTNLSGVYLDYELATPIEYELAEPIVPTVTAGTTEARISPNSDGLSAPMLCDMTYDANANNDSANSQYAAVAGRLLNSHKLWGQDFDGTQDVEGALTGVTNLNSLLYLGSTNVGIGQSNPQYKLDVSGTARMTGAVTLGSTLSVAGNTTVGGTLGVTGATTLTDALTANGAVSINNTLTVGTSQTNRATTLNGTLTVSGATTLNGALTVNNTAKIANTLTLGSGAVYPSFFLNANAQSGLKIWGEDAATSYMLFNGGKLGINMTPTNTVDITGTLGVSGLATIAGGVKLTTTKKIWFDDKHFIELLNGYLHTNLPIVSDSYITAGAANTNA